MNAATVADMAEQYKNAIRAMLDCINDVDTLRRMYTVAHLENKRSQEAQA